MKVTFDIIKCEDCPHHSFNHDCYSTHCGHPATPHHVGSWDYGRDMPGWCPLRENPEPFPEPPSEEPLETTWADALQKANELFADTFEAVMAEDNPLLSTLYGRKKLR